MTGEKNTHPSVYGVKEFVTLSVCLFLPQNSHFRTESPIFLLLGTSPPKIATRTCTIRRGVWNLPHKFHLYLILSISFSLSCHCFIRGSALFYLIHILYYYHQLYFEIEREYTFCIHSPVFHWLDLYVRINLGYYNNISFFH